MKLILTTILLFTCLGYSADIKSKKLKTKQVRKISNVNINSAEYTAVLAGFNSLDKSNIDKNFRSAFDSMEKFSEINLLTENELPLVVSILKALVLMDPLDESRTASQMMTASYHRNTLIYKKAFKQLSAEDQKVMSDIIKVFGSPDKRGNG